MNKTDLSTFENSWFNPGGNSIKRVIWYFTNIFLFKSSLFPFYGMKTSILRMFGAKVGKDVCIKPCVNIKYPWNLSLGINVWIGEKVWIDNLTQVTIKDNVCISQGAMLLCGNHNYKKTSFDLIIGQIVLENGSWIGAKALVCPGVTAHEGSILTVKSVATQDLDAMGIYQGNPARKIRTRVFES